MKNDFFKKLIAKAILELYGISAEIVVERPKDFAHGDYASNAALIIAKQLGKSPLDIAQELAAYLDKTKESFVAAVTVAGPGFINFTISRAHIVDAIREAAHVATYGHTNVYTGKKILVEHSSPNLFKPFHIGHLMNNTIGEAVTRIAQYSGAQVTAMSFPSDISLGVAKAIFVLLERGVQDFSIQDLGDAYVAGTKRYDEEEQIHARVKEIADNLYAHTASPELELFTKAKKLNISYFESIVAKLGSHFDSYIYESEAGIIGKSIVEANVPNVFTKSEGAIVFVPDENRKDINTAVFINSQGNPTYEAKDIGLIDMKFNHFSPDISIFVTDTQQVPHFNVVLAAADKINDEWKVRVQKSLHIPHGRMTFKGQKMSSRLGGVPLVEDILAAVTDEVKAKNPDVSDADAQIIGIAALKFSILRAQAGKNIDFDPETSLSFEGDSGPYVQYTAVRAQSLLHKGTEQGIVPDAATPVSGSELIERLIARFPEIIVQTQREWAPHTLVSYLLELTQAFNSYYGNTKIIDEDKAASAYRLAVVSALRTTLTNGLNMLGIEVPSKM
jgi:arginyl-tRNA synthetase